MNPDRKVGGRVIQTTFRTLVRVLACLGALLVLITLLPPRWYVTMLAGPWRDPGGAVLIVLGAEVVEGPPMIGYGSYWRSVYAAHAWREGTFHHLVLSGDAAITSPMRDFLVCQGVPADAITVEGRSTSTRENALFTAETAHRFSGPYVLLTSDYHMWRAWRTFRKAGLNVEPRPVPDLGNA